MSKSISVSRRRFLACAGTGAVGLLAVGNGFAQAQAKQSKPNFIFILSDDQDWSGLSVQMHPEIPGSKSDFYRTPNLETLAGQGMRFSNAYAPAPVCSPTRVSIQTGKSPAQLHWTKASPDVTAADDYRLIPPTSEKNIPKEEITIAEMLKGAGYTTAHFGKWHLGGGGPGDHGYDVHDGNTSNKDAAPFVDPNPVDIFGMSGRANALMEACVREGKSFFIQLSYHALHYPENSLKITQESYRHRAPGKMHKDVERAAMTENLDTGVGMIMKQVEALGIADNTYIIYMSDNGAGGGGAGVRPLHGGKGSLWEGGIRVPLIIRGPGVKANSFCDVPVVGYDLFPTLCSLGKVSARFPHDVEGGNISPLFVDGKGEVKRVNEALAFHFPHYQGADGPHSSIRLGDFKLIKFYETGALKLFNIAQDIGEQNDRAQAMPEKVAELHARLEQYLKTVDAGLPTLNPNYGAAGVPLSKRDATAKGRKGASQNRKESED